MARLGPGRRVDLALDPAQRRKPATGVVVLGAAITDACGEGEAGYRLMLDEPGDWYDALSGRRWLPGRGGPPLLAWGWTPRLATG